MLDFFFNFLHVLDAFFWGYVGFILILALGIYFTVKSRFFQIRQITGIFSVFFNLLGKKERINQRGIHPLKAFFASAGGLIGIGNVVGIVTAIQFGGPGALLWVWMAGMIGSITKYCEIYLGHRYRLENQVGGYDGGPLYYLGRAFRISWIPLLFAGLLCVYGVDIYQFSVITESVSSNWGWNRMFVVGALLTGILYAGKGGIQRVGKICAWVIPLFIFSYFGMCLWVVLQHGVWLPSLLAEIFRSAFTGHAAVGGFAGSTVMMTIQHGIARAAYSSDIGVGYDSIIQSESSAENPEKQARLSILGVLIDNLVCTISILAVLVTGVWKAPVPIEASHLVQTALSQYFPYMHLFMPLFFIMVGYTTIISYIYVGTKCARYLSPRWGGVFYTLYAIAAFVFFSFFDQSKALLVMSVSGAMLLIINTIGMICLRREIVFNAPAPEKKVIATD